MRRLCLFLFVLFANNCQSQKQDSAAITRVDKLFANWVKTDPGYAIGITKGGKLVYQKYFGLANAEYNIPITHESVFDVGSVSKQFTAAGIALLQFQGKLSIDDPITKYLPEFPSVYSKIKISNLIYHTSGIRQWEMLEMLGGKNPEKGYYTNEIIIELLKNQRGLNFMPGEKYLYSNGGYILLAEIIKRVSGKSLKEFAKEYIFDPLGMADTFFLDDQTKLFSNKVTGYQKNEDKTYHEYIDMNNSYGGGNLHTTIEDLSKWQNNYIHNQLGYDLDLIKLLLTEGKLNNGKKIGYGLGLELKNYKGLKTISHTGYWPGFRSRLVTFPELDYSVIFITNNSDNIHSDQTAFDIAEAYAPQFFELQKEETKSTEIKEMGQPSKQKKAIASYTSNQLTQFTGLYYSDEINKVYKIKIEKGYLILQIDQDNLKLSAGQPAQFTFQETMILIFKRSNNTFGFSLNVGDDVKGLFFKRI